MKYLLLYWLGITSLWRWFRRKHITVIMIHGVMSEIVENRWVPARWQLDQRILDRYLRCLTKNYNFITVAEAVAMIQGSEPLRSNCAIVTIDDGYKNSYEQAWPVFKKHNITPMVFVATSLIDSHDYYWFDRLDVSLQQAAEEMDEVLFLGERLRLQAGDYASLAETCRRIIRNSRRVYPDDSARNAALSDFVSSLKISDMSKGIPTEAVDKWIAVLGVGDIDAAREDGLQFGSHTQSHARLPCITSAERQIELSGSKSRLEKILGHDCDYFCYPEGAVDKQSAGDVSSAGYRAAFATHSQMPTVGSDVMNIGRVHLPRNASDAVLLAVVSGLSGALQQKMQMAMSFFRSSMTRVSGTASLGRPAE